MTLKKLWLTTLTFITIIAITINTLILIILTNQYFFDYLNESYKTHLNQIINYTKTTLSSDNISYEQMAIELESHLNDPIIEIKLYDSSGKLLVDVSNDYYKNSPNFKNMMEQKMIEHMMHFTSKETHQFKITSNNKTIGIINITIHNVAENSFVAKKFKSRLIINSLYSIIITIIISTIIGILISSNMTNSLKDTEKLANDIQLGKDVEFSTSKIKEINSIKESLLDLYVRLRLKQKTRKSLVDQLIHQTRTPLTILQSHLEAIEDGIIEMSANELNTFKNQINDINSIISNMTSLIDAKTENKELKIEQFNINTLIKQIYQGLITQFKKKHIQLILNSNKKILVQTDKRKLSQAIYNILINAYKYTDANGVVSISYLKTDSEFILEVQDSGQGIPKEEMPKIFNAYYRSSLTSKIKGDGLGLYIVQENIDSIKGKIQVQSQVGYGSIFTIKIPLNFNKE